VPLLQLDTIRPVLFGDVLIQEAELLDGNAPGVRQQLVADVVLLGERGQYRHGIVADGEQRDSPMREVVIASLQLDELRPAERSPVGAAIEDDQCLAACSSGVQIDQAAALVGQFDVWEYTAHPRADRVEIDHRRLR
jgi:hypothetical protein